MTKPNENQSEASESSATQQSPDSERPIDLSYEAAFAQLEEILNKLERDDLPLEDSLTLYEQGMALVEHCTGVLDSATLRVQQWQEDGATTELEGWQEG